MLTAHQLFLTHDLLRRNHSLTFEEARHQAIAADTVECVGHLTANEGVSMNKKKRAANRLVPPGISIATVTIAAHAPEPTWEFPSNNDYDLTTAVRIAINRVLLGEDYKRPLSRSLRQAAHEKEL